MEDPSSFHHIPIAKLKLTFLNDTHLTIIQKMIVFLWQQIFGCIYILIIIEMCTNACRNVETTGCMGQRESLCGRGNIENFKKYLLFQYNPLGVVYLEGYM